MLKNKSEVAKIESKIIRSLEIVYVDNIEQVVKEALRNS